MKNIKKSTELILSRSKTKYFYIVFFLLSFFWGYSGYWVPYYISYFQTSKIDVLLPLQSFKLPSCNEPEQLASYCSDMYALPTSYFNKDNKKSSLGLGFILSTITYGCYDDSKFTPMFSVGDTALPSRNQQVLHTY